MRDKTETRDARYLFFCLQLDRIVVWLQDASQTERFNMVKFALSELTRYIVIVSIQISCFLMNTI